MWASMWARSIEVIAHHLAARVDIGGNGAMIDTIIEAISSPRGVEGRERAVAVNETMPTCSIEVIARHLAAGVDAGGIGGSGARCPGSA